MTKRDCVRAWTVRFAPGYFGPTAVGLLERVLSSIELNALRRLSILPEACG